ncbi:PREDICTED: E3 ubiquitin-protein ligase CHIP-like isoform X2 [Nicotiana attenuata]|uniref:E3 ubiquitin-protein ligase CHIP-like isoform X2 n=1 Tax=Nicotiana attenuata TaxID=49451 RepID=UPI000904BB1A|nr:PREDICTED: E3 ubiquitin-protein ligase CHIP-like isoform X2 [Nicotiana attenuata]
MKLLHFESKIQKHARVALSICFPGLLIIMRTISVLYLESFLGTGSQFLIHHHLNSELSIKALDLGRGANPNSYMVEEIWQELAKAKYLEWEHESSRRTWELKKLKETCESALKERHGRDSSQIEGFIDRSTSLVKQLDALGRVFRKAAEDDTPTEITLDIFRDPVITPSGVTYERAVILDHLDKVGKFDPVTREPLKPSQLVPNLALKEAVHAFLDKHGWAYRMG